MYSLGPFQSDDNWLTQELNVQPRAVVRELRFYRCKSGPNFEIFEWEAPERALTPPRNFDVGGHHLAFYVEDLDSAVESLKDKHVRVLGEPVNSSGPSSGQRWIYFLTPWDMQCELVSFPEGKAYEDSSDVILWHPSRPSN